VVYLMLLVSRSLLFLANYSYYSVSTTKWPPKYKIDSLGSHHHSISMSETRMTNSQSVEQDGIEAGNIFIMLDNANRGVNRMKFISLATVPYILPFV